MPLALRPKTESEMDHRKAVLSLRWLLVILASYLTLFSYIGSEQFPVALGIALAFSLTNIVLMFVPRQQFTADHTLNGAAILDLVFVSLTLYLLRIQGNYLYLGFCHIRPCALVVRSAAGSGFALRREHPVRRIQLLSIHQLSDRCKHRTVSDSGAVLRGRYPLPLSVGAVDAGCQEGQGDHRGESHRGSHGRDDPGLVIVVEQR